MSQNDVFSFKYKSSNMEIYIKNFFLEASKYKIKDFLNIVKEVGKSAELRTILHEKVDECDEVIVSINGLYNQCEDILSDYFDRDEKILRPSQLTKILKIRERYVFALKILMEEDDSVKILKETLDKMHIPYRDIQPGEEGGFYYIDKDGNRQKYEC